MPNISQRAQNLPQSAIRKFVQYADQRKQQGIEVLHFNIGQPDILSPPEAFATLKQYSWCENQMECFPAQVIAYAKSAGIDSYRQKLIEYYQRYNINLDKDNIIITNGGSEALIFALNTICDPGDKIIIPEPYYTNYNTFCLMNDIKIIPLPTKIEDNFRLNNLRSLEKLITSRTKAILICTPGNPTGTVYSQIEMQQICHLALKHNLFIISDEVYRELCYDDLTHTSIMHFPEAANHSIMIDSASKRYSMCGARIGRLVTKNQEVFANVLKLAQSRLSVSTIDQLMGQAILDNTKYIETAKQEYDERRKTAYQILSQGGLKCGYPSAALYMIVELGDNIDAEKFTEFMIKDFSLNNKTVLVTPAKGFYATPGLGHNQIRLAFVLNEKKIKQGCQILLEGLKEFTNKS